MYVRAMSVVMLGAMMVCGGVARADWPAFRGPNGDGTADPAVVGKGTPRELWRVPLGEGFGTVAVAGGKVFAMAEQKGNEACVALDGASGKTLWTYELDKTIFEKQGGNGPRTTPAADGKFVYITGTYLKVACLEAETGKLVWSHDLPKEFGAQKENMAISKWGAANSPVIDDKRVYVYGGGDGATLLAFDKATGALAWKAGNEKITHATPTLATVLGVRQVIYFCQSGLVSLAVDSGKELWRFAFPFKVAACSTPIVVGDWVYCSAGYNVGAALAEITRSGDTYTAKQIWRSKPDELQNHWTTPVYQNGHLYGIYGWRAYGTAPLQCVELASGKVKWSKEGFGPGGTILSGDVVVVQSDAGRVSFVKATPEKYEEIASFQAVAGKCWNMSVVANGRLYARASNPNAAEPAKGELACFELAK